MAQTALITGAARRIGKEITIHLAQKGWNVAVHYNSSEDEAKLLCEELKGKFPNQLFERFQADLLRTDDVERLMAAVVQKFGSPDLLINNASGFNPATITLSDTAFFDRLMAINFRAPFILSRDFARLANRGVIVNFVDTRIVTNQPGYAAYSLSKKALWELTKMSALEFGPNIRVNAIAPGLTLPPEEKETDYLWKLSAKIAMKRPGGLEPIVRSLDYILQNDYLTGQILFCDGGENLGLTN
jgi:NAD(P)-dependent dehydrogenase (short-subunit alcohol dehydrogenase family)